jgi:hypothetical protein
VFAAPQLLFGFLQLLPAVAGGQRPDHLHALAHRAAEQRAGGEAECLAGGVEQGGLDGALGREVARGSLAHAQAIGLEGERRLAEQYRRQVIRDRGLDRFHALLGPARPAERRGFADTGHAVVEQHAHQHVALMRDFRVRELVPTTGRHLHDGGADAADRGVLCVRLHSLHRLGDFDHGTTHISSQVSSE